MKQISAHYDAEQDNIRFQRNFNRVLWGFVVLVFLYLTASTYGILSSTPIYMHDWRGPLCIILVVVAFSVYVYATRLNTRSCWPPSLMRSILLWCGMYFSILLLSFIDNAFLWDFYVLFSCACSLFRWRALFIVEGITALTMFTLEGLLTWPINAGQLMGIAGQSVFLFSVIGLCVLFQHLIIERIERNHLFQQLQRTNEELEQAHRKLEQSIEQEQELAVLRERTRLAREMHDTLGHALVLITVKLEAAQRLRARDPERCDRELESTKEVARDSMTALRASIANLRSPALEREQMWEALERAVKEMAQRAGLRATCEFEADIEQLSASHKEALWKVSQEALTNIEKHARAHEIHLCIRQATGELILTIQDDGIGLPDRSYHYDEEKRLRYNSPNGHYGVRGMLERAENAGGRFSLHSGSGTGTRIEVALPLEAPRR